MKKRRLRPDERDLWDQVARTTTPLSRKSPASATEQAGDSPRLSAVVTPRPDTASIGSFTMGERARQAETTYDLAPGMSSSLASLPVDMDKKAYTRLKRGKLRPEGRIDLHGMTLDQAHPALTRFILKAHADGKRLVLVITGKGKPSPDDGPIPRRIGVLRHTVPLWLRTGALASAVLQISESHMRHGGAGAYYVYLRKRR